MPTFVDANGDITGWTVQEDANPDTVNGQGGIETVTYTADEVDVSVYGTEQVFTDDLHGEIVGRVTSWSETETSANVTLTGPLNAFNVVRRVYPGARMLKDHLRGWCIDVGLIHPGDPYYITVPDDETAIWVLPGFYGNMWEWIRNLLAVARMDLVFENGTYALKHMEDADTLSLGRVTGRSQSLDQYNPARYNEIHYYNNESAVQGEMYPINNADATVYQVEAGETITVRVESRGWLYSVNQPECVDWVEADPDYYDGTDGAYSIIGNDNLPFPAARWNAEGGYIDVEIDDDPKYLNVTIHGASSTDYAPYRVAMSSGNAYNSLRITGDGVRSTPKSILFPTGAPASITTEEIGETIEVPFVSSYADALRAGAAVASRTNGVTHTLSLNMDDVDSNFRSTASQVFVYNDCEWRVSSASFSPTGVSVDATPRKTMAAQVEAWSDQTTMATQVAQWEGKRMIDMMVQPLKRDA